MSAVEKAGTGVRKHVHPEALEVIDEIRQLATRWEQSSKADKAIHGARCISASARHADVIEVRNLLATVSQRISIRNHSKLKREAA